MHSKSQRAGTRLAKSRVVVLLSGGIDSAACLAFYLSQRFRVEALFVDCGQISANKERRAARAISRYYRVPFREIRLMAAKPKGPGLVQGRNAFLLLAALLEFGDASGLIALGIHSGTTYRDCSPAFVRRMQTLFDLYAGGSIQVSAPFLRWRKSDVWQFARSKGVPMRQTYSCERGRRQPCGSCSSCHDLEALSAGTLHKN